jgi:hypothetical protein
MRHLKTAEMLYILRRVHRLRRLRARLPVEAIFSLDETPQKWDAFIGKNSE